MDDLTVDHTLESLTTSRAQYGIAPSPLDTAVSAS